MRTTTTTQRQRAHLMPICDFAPDGSVQRPGQQPDVANTLALAALFLPRSLLDAPSPAGRSATLIATRNGGGGRVRRAELPRRARLRAS